jgi:ABC-type uncharacterized transport system substrate-binding protein
MKKNTFRVGLTMMVGLLAVSLVLMPAHAQARNIKVGIIDCYSGPPAVFGKDALNGFKLALKEINRKGVLGKKIEYTTRDTKFKVDLALNFAKELVLREDVDVIVGTINSGAALAVSEAVAKKEKVPFIVWISKSENITQKVKTSPAKKAIVTFSQPEKIRPWPANPAGWRCPPNPMSNIGLPVTTMNMDMLSPTLPGAT